jgi:hypothetical protein
MFGRINYQHATLFCFGGEYFYLIFLCFLNIFILLRFNLKNKYILSYFLIKWIEEHILDPNAWKQLA